jgi:ATP-dependent helicase/DNAse subunit B
VKEILSKEINNSIIIAPNELKSYFVLLKNDNLDLDFKFFTKEDVLKDLFGTYNEQAIRYLMKENNETYSTTKKKLNYLTSGATNLFDSEGLSKNKLIYKDEYSKKLYSMSRILFIGYKIDDLEIKHIIDFLKLTNYKFFDLNDLEFKENLKEYSSFESKGQEVRYVLNKIAESIKKDGKRPSEIEIICNVDEYKFYLSTFGDAFKIPLNFNERNTLFETYSAKLILNNLNNIKDYLCQEDKFINDQANYKLIKYLYHFYDLDNDKNLGIDLIEILKDFKVRDAKYLDGVKVTSSFSFDETKDYYILGAIDSFLPKIFDDNDLISDKVKKENDLTTSIIKNEYNFNETLAFLKFSKLVSITYPRENGKNDIAFILKNNGFKEKKLSLMMTQYSTKIAELYFYDYNFKFNFFREENPEFPYLKNNFKVKNLYSHAYKEIKEINQEKQKYSYTTIEKYVECPFKYYCDQVLNLGCFEDTTAIKFGNFAHQILEHVYDDGFDLNSLVNETKKEYIFDNREEALLPRFIYEINNSVKKIQEQNAKYPLTKTYSEKPIDLDFNRFLITGKIDRLSLYDNSLVIIDYKSGKNFDFNEFYFDKYGLSMQLPTYLLMIDNLSEFKDYKIAGLLYKPISSNKVYNYYLDEKDLIEHGKMVGIVNGDKEILSKFDGSFLVDKSDYISGLKIEKKGNVKGTKTCIVSSDDEFKNISNKALEYYSKFDTRIHENDFAISPYSINDKEHEACTYCIYNDICYHNDNDYREFENPKKEVGENGDGTD